MAPNGSNPLNLDPVYNLPSFLLRDGTFEQGDTGHNAYTVLYCEPNVAYAEHCKALLFSADGWPRRSPDVNHWYGLPERCSRDLLTPVLCYAVAHDRALFWQLVCVMSTKCFLFADNPVPNYAFNAHKRKLSDVLGPDIWAVVLRGLIRHAPGPNWLRKALELTAAWLLCALDLHGLVRAVLRLLKPGSHDQRNSALKHHLCGTLLPTPISRLALLLYRASKPCKAFTAWWTKPGEPRIDTYMRKLFGC